MSNLQQTLTIGDSYGNIKKEFVIERTPRHKYSYHVTAGAVEGEKSQQANMPSVTTIGGYIGAASFGAGVGWAQSVIRKNNGDPDSPKAAAEKAMQLGTALHDAIDRFVQYREMPGELDDAFMSWHREIGSQHTWVASELLVVDPFIEIGGTIDAISVENGSYAIWDWKTKDRNAKGTFHKDPKDQAQIAAYARALRRLGHQFAPQLGYICYIMRDGSGLEIIKVDLLQAERLFDLGYGMYHALKGIKS